MTSLLKETQNAQTVLTECSILNEHIEGFVSIQANSVLVQEDIKKFIDDAREFIKNGNLPHYNKKSELEKDDENEDGVIEDPADRVYYFSKMLSGLLYYMKKDLKNKDIDAFNDIAGGVIDDKYVDMNLKDIGVKNLKSFMKRIADNFKLDSVKSKIGQYLDDIEDYFVIDQSQEQPA